ncbi:hypothetical protein Clacol_008300 [Clathrus columnatus]|uniref:Serine hydrolase domain-containing protein n=1 Tax=Clathrus columnatus TaxID=1419009 RepID=A0AAV5AKM2_9AGAM|nr:hypothetical protein Clacol_008300 [Clathrus columnatus]
MVFPDAPTILHPVDIPTDSQAWLDAAATNNLVPKDDPALIPRAWWRANADKTVCEGLERSLESLKEILKNDVYDGVLGFSQGAAMAGILAAILERPELYPPYIENGVPIHPKLQFFVPISGFCPRDPLLETILSPSTPKLTTYSLHIMGNTDVVVLPERSLTLIESCDEAYTRIETHEGDWSPGVIIPSP